MTLRQKNITINIVKGVLIVFLFMMPVLMVSIPPSGIAADRVGIVIVTDPSLVCMTNNMYMGKPQIAVEVDDKIYYGCCKMCAGNLEKNAETRQAVDPFTGNKVDKAAAVIAAKPSGEVLYFESEETFNDYGNSSAVKEK